MSARGLTAHIHQWGAWHHDKIVSGIAYRRIRYVERRLCLNRWCPMAQGRNGRVFIARLGRLTPAGRAAVAAPAPRASGDRRRERGAADE